MKNVHLSIKFTTYNPKVNGRVEEASFLNKALCSPNFDSRTINIKVIWLRQKVILYEHRIFPHIPGVLAGMVVLDSGDLDKRR